MVIPFLTVGSATWLVLLTLAPGLRDYLLFLLGTCLWLASNSVVSWIILFQRKRLLFTVNVLQVLLLAMLFCQIHGVLGPGHFEASHVPLLLDWQIFAWAHAIHAADFLRLLPELGVRPHFIQPNSLLVLVLLAAMNLHVSVYVVGLLVRRLSRVFVRSGAAPDPQGRRLRKRRLQVGSRYALLLSAGAVLATAGRQGWSIGDCLAWPLDQSLRTLDLGRILYTFGWRLHDVESSTWLSVLGLCYRLAFGFVVVQILCSLQLRWLGAQALRPLEDFVEDLHHPQETVREAAARALRNLGPHAAETVPDLIHALEEDSAGVGTAVRGALRRLGPTPESRLPELVANLRNPNWALRRAAAAALGNMGPTALAAVPCLVEKLADEDPSLPPLAEKALCRIYPGWERGSTALSSVPALIAKLGHSSRRIRQQAADVLGRLGPAARRAASPLIFALGDREEFVRLSAELALERIYPEWRTKPMQRRSLLVEAGILTGEA